MAYYNRRRQLEHTLQTIAQSCQRDVEIVIVDDFSEPAQQIQDIPEKYPQLKFQIIEMRSQVDKKYYCNPCVPYNVGFRASQGDMILIQNPECCHMGDVLNHVANNLDHERYLSFHTYGCTKEDLAFLYAGQPVPMFSHSKKARWYNHETERPAAFHFCNAISRNNLVALNGFDERFAYGHNYDDTELVQRIKNLGLQIQFVSDPWSIHQYHPKSYGHPDNPQPTQNNQLLYQQLLDTKLVRAPNSKSIT